jgi:hypothetical protein
MFMLLVPHTAHAPADSRREGASVLDVAASAQLVDPAPTGARFVTYNRVRVTVPATWPVIDLRLLPRTCVRFDRAVVYLGSPGSQSDCPAHAVGRTNTIWLRNVSAGRKDPLTSHKAKVGGLAARVGVNPIGHDKQAQFVAAAVELEATWGADSSSVDNVLASAVQLPGPSAPAPTTSGSAATATSDLSAAAAQPVSYSAATSAIAAGSTFTGMAFDTCAAPPASAMTSWLASPYRSAGIYIGGSMRACGDGNLSAAWTAAVRSMGWGLMPIYVGLQAPCVNQSGLSTITASQAAAQGTASADDAVSRAKFFGLSAGAPIYYDMEAYNSSALGCSQTVMSFISAWTSELHRLGYKSGAYGSTASLMVDMSRSVTSAGFVAPDNVWFAHWNQLQTTSDSASYPSFPDVYWSDHQRMHQYAGGHNDTWGGITVNIDANWVDAAVAGTAVPVDYGTNVVGPGGNGFVFTGSMAYWRSGAPAGLKGLAYWTYSNGSTESNGATWSPQLAPGRYNVEANIPSTNTTANAPYTIRDAFGTTTKMVNQQLITGYTSLGVYTARAGSPISVHVGDNDPSSTSTQIGVDAMAFRLVATAPSPPGAVSAVGGNGQAVVSWGAASANGSPVTGYTVTASPGGRSATTTGATTATLTGLTNGTSYTFTVTATNAVGTSAPSAPSNAVTPSEMGRYTPVSPVRLLDTRVGTATNPVRTAVPAGGTIKVAVAGISGSPVPAGATAVALNVTVTAPRTAGFVSAAAAVPNGSSSLNFVAGQTVSNMVISKIAPDGTVSIYNGSGGTVQLVADVQGYNTPTDWGTGWMALSPVRLLDTRVGTATNPVRNAVPALGTIKVAVAGISGSPVPAGATAVALNVTVTAPRTAGFVSAAAAVPNGSSSLNFVAGQTVSNMVISKIAPDGTVSIYNGSGGTVQLVADVQGYNTPTDWGTGWMALSPVRLLDTRVGTATNPVRNAVPALGTIKVAVAGISGSPVPAGATAVALNVTVTAPRTAGFVSAAAAVPNGSSSLNFVAGQTVANLVISKIAPDGTVSIYNGSGGTVQLVADVQGYNK